MSDQFIHLNLHSEYSLVDGLIRIDELVKKTKAFNMSAVALTDLCNFFATVKFFKVALSFGIKPLIGSELFIANPSLPKQPFLVIALCQNLTGYKNLTKLITKAYQQGQQGGVPLLSQQAFQKDGDGLLILSGGITGDIGAALVTGKYNEAKSKLAIWKQLFPNRFYLEIYRTGQPNEEAYISAAADLAHATQTPLVASNRVRFLFQQDFEAHETRVCVHQGFTLADKKRPMIYSPQQYFRSAEEMVDLFKDMPEAIENTVEIAKRCTVELPLKQLHLPKFVLPESTTAEQCLFRHSIQGLEERFVTIIDSDIDLSRQQDIKTKYQRRLQQELDVINRMGFASYFLIVADFIHWAKQNSIPVGPGRGSGAGSLVSYALKITNLDPIEYDLLFERFLNPERVSMPDFDIDFCIEGRDKVIQYVASKYGHQNVAQIITFGTMAAKAVVRDVGRVLGHPYGYVDKIAKLIPFELGITLNKALSQEEELEKRYQQEDEVKILIDLARKLEGITRNVGKHAGGVVIAPTQLTDFTALYCEPDGSNLLTQFDKDDIEIVGLVKFDFLGLRTLTIINWTLVTINHQSASTSRSQVDLSWIPLNDTKTFELLKACQTTAVFQLESRGMKDLIKRLQPDCFEDIIALVALFRPGPLQSGMVDDFIDRKRGRSQVKYSHPKLESILKSTYGVILYQEQVMQIAQMLAGYTLGAADLLRRAMGKKKPKEMAKQRTIFLSGSIKRGINEHTANHIFDLMEKFAGYGFNKSHSAAYALIAYQTAWLKANFPAEYMSAVLSSELDKTEKLVMLIDECRQMKLTILPPDINSSLYRFTVGQKNHLVYGLGAIKGVGEAAIQPILSARDKSGPFKGLYDFCQCIDMRKVSRRTIEAFIQSGAMDSLGSNRALLMAEIEPAIKYVAQISRTKQRRQLELFSELSFDTNQHHQLINTEVKQWPDLKRLQGEKETLGWYMSGHPLDYYRPEVQQFTTCPIAEASGREGQSIIIAGIVLQIKKVMSKRGDRFAFLTLDDGSGRLEIAVFSEIYQKCKDYLEKDAILVVEGQMGIDKFNDSFRLNTQSVLSLEDARKHYAKGLRIILKQNQLNAQLFDDLSQLLAPSQSRGIPVYIVCQQETVSVELKLAEQWCIEPDATTLQRLNDLLAEEQVRFCY